MSEPSEVSDVDSILTSTKKLLSVAKDDTAFDTDIILNINAAFFTLYQIGVGPDDGFEITDATQVWQDYLGGAKKKYNSVQQFVYISVRLIFDPPANSFVTEALKTRLDELTVRLNYEREETKYVDPNLPVVVVPVIPPDGSID